MSNITGKDGAVKSGADVLAELRGFNIEQTTEALDNAVIDGSGHASNKAGQKSWSATIDAFYDPADPVTSQLTNGAEVDLEFFPSGDTTGEQEYAGTGLCTAISTPIEINGMVQQSFSVACASVLTITTIV